MSLVLSVQSSVAYGYVGNRAAIIPLNALGHEVVALNTVSFSNHTGYGDWTGEVFSAAQLSDLIKGIKARGLFPKIDAVLTGYIGDEDLGALVLDTLGEIRAANPNCIYCCDPVMGDVGSGFFVNPRVSEFFKGSAIDQADIIVPNQFEASFLSGIDIKTRVDALRAFERLHARGIKRIVMTSFQPDNLEPDKISMLISDQSTQADQDSTGVFQVTTSQKSNGVFQVTTPRFAMDPMPNGAGDVTAATILAHLLKGADLRGAVEHTAGALHDIFDLTEQAQRRELNLIRAQNAFLEPSQVFKAVRIA
jgi:pyridoxine kinase